MYQSVIKLHICVRFISCGHYWKHVVRGHFFDDLQALVNVTLTLMTLLTRKPFFNLINRCIYRLYDLI